MSSVQSAANLVVNTDDIDLKENKKSISSLFLLF